MEIVDGDRMVKSTSAVLLRRRRDLEQLDAAMKGLRERVRALTSPPTRRSSSGRSTWRSSFATRSAAPHQAVRRLLEEEYADSSTAVFDIQMVWVASPNCRALTCHRCASG
jgi:hypothetical protein